MKNILIYNLFKEFEKDKELIKQNLLKAMDSIGLEVADEYGKLTMTIKYEKIEQLPKK